MNKKELQYTIRRQTAWLLVGLICGSLLLWTATARALQRVDIKQDVSQEHTMYLAGDWQSDLDINTILSANIAEDTQPVHAYALSDDDLEMLCLVVMAEAGGESYDGQLAVAQCILSGCEKERCSVSELVQIYHYATPAKDYTADVRAACVAAMMGARVTDEPILYFYAPARCNSNWHESQRYVMTIGGHRFFAEA